MLNAAIVGATGYTGVELAKILLRHPRVKLTALTTRQETAIPLQDLVPGVSKKNSLEVRKFSFPEIKRKADVVFLALPHTEAMDLGSKFFEAGKIVIDLSADFRIKNVPVYEKWYGVKHTARKHLKEAVYGLPELYRDQIRRANLIANPGCYPTGACLGIVPLLKEGLVDSESIVVDAKSGVSGAGKKLNPATQFCEVDENFYAYKVNRHQHTPEIEQVLSDAAGESIHLTFIPHLLPLNRGLLSTIYLKKKSGVSFQDIQKAFEKAYGDEPFVKLCPEGEFPSLKDVQGTNFCRIGFSAPQEKKEVVVITAIDNLIKGASGQAVQNLNVRSGFPEEEGLLS